MFLKNHLQEKMVEIYQNQLEWDFILQKDYVIN